MKEKIEQKAALAALNHFFRNEIEPVGLDQVYSLDANVFERWVRQSSLKKVQKKKLARILKPLLDASAIEGVVFRGATLVEDGSRVDMAILAIPEAFTPKLSDTDIFIIYADSDGDGNGDGGDNGDDDNQQDTCQYHRCFCANPSNCGCVTATQFNKDCPDDECSSDKDCGGSDGGSDGGIREVLGAF